VFLTGHRQQKAIKKISAFNQKSL